MLTNPIVQREMRRLRHVRRWWSPVMRVALLFLAIGLAMMVMAIAGGRLGQSACRLGIAITYLLMTGWMAWLVAESFESERRIGTLDQLWLTRLTPDEIELGQTWAALIPIAVSSAVAALGLIALFPSPGWSLSIALAWVLLVSHLHFTALLAANEWHRRGGRSWMAALTVMAGSLALDLFLIGLILKPTVLLMHFIDRHPSKVIGSRRHTTPPGSDPLPTVRVK